jgi:transposase
MPEKSQTRAVKNYRKRLARSGFARFEVLGRGEDRELIRSVARRLAESGPEAKRLRLAVSKTAEGEHPAKGGILAALRRSPLVAANITVTRSKDTGRKLDL